ncbi:MAG: TrmB family transcriptional regulator [Acidimicrobiales bacterium]
MARKRNETNGAGAPAPGPGPIPDALRQEFTLLGLTPNEAGVLLALLRLGPAKVPQIAELSGVPRTAVYQVLEDLGAQRLAERLPTEGAAVWVCPGRDQVLARMYSNQEERLRQHAKRSARVREMLAESFPEAPSLAQPYVHIVRQAAQVQQIYNELLTRAKTELVMFTRPPYASNEVNPVVIDTLARGVRARVLYQEGALDDPAAQAWLRAYHDAGVEARVVDELPLKMVVVDREALLVGMNDPVAPEAGYPTTVFIEHPGYAGVQADGFELRWADARPWTPPGAGDGDKGDDVQHQEGAKGGRKATAPTPGHDEEP